VTYAVTQANREPIFGSGSTEGYWQWALVMAAPHWSYETPQPWEERHGTLVDRVVRVSAEAQRVYAQQEALLPTIHHEHVVDPAIGDHLADVGKRIQILEENARKPDKKALAIAQKQSVHKRVIPSRFPEHDDEEHDDDRDDTAFIQGRIVSARLVTDHHIRVLITSHAWDGT
jgi:hypothetical protein